MRGKKKKKILASEDGSCFPDSSVFHFCQSSPVRSAGNPALHLKTSSIFSIGPLTDQSCTQIIFILWYFLCVFYFEFIFDFVAPSAQKPFKRLSSSRMPKKKNWKPYGLCWDCARGARCRRLFVYRTALTVCVCSGGDCDRTQVADNGISSSSSSLHSIPC